MAFGFWTRSVHRSSLVTIFWTYCHVIAGRRKWRFRTQNWEHIFRRTFSNLLCCDVTRRSSQVLTTVKRLVAHECWIKTLYNSFGFSSFVKWGTSTFRNSKRFPSRSANLYLAGFFLLVPESLTRCHCMFKEPYSAGRIVTGGKWYN